MDPTENTEKRDERRLGHVEFSCRAVFDVNEPPWSPDFPATTFTRQTFSDLGWKAQAAFHHCARVVQIEHLMTAQLESCVPDVEEQTAGRWLTIAREPTPLLRYEFEALLNASYGYLNVLAKALVETLTDRPAAHPSFRSRLVKVLRNNVPEHRREVAARVLSAIEADACRGPNEFLSRSSARDRISHSEHLRHRPIQIVRADPPLATVTRIDDENVTVTAAHPMKATIEASWVAGLLVRQFIVAQTDGLSDTTCTAVTLAAGEVDQAQSFAERATGLTTRILRLGAESLDAITKRHRVEAAATVETVLSRLQSMRDAMATSGEISSVQMQLLDDGRVGALHVSHAPNPTTTSKD